MDDRVIISCVEETDLWHWRRVTPDGLLAAKDPVGYSTPDACQAEAVRVNAKPYILELRAATGLLLPTVDVEALAGERPEKAT